MARWAACILAAGLAVSTQARAVTAIYSFGDSLSDVGNDYVATGGAIPASPYYMGRFSNGPNWLDDLANYYGIGPLQPSLVPGGTDYAYGGARSGANTVVPVTPTLGLAVPTTQDQVNGFVGTHPAAPASALYTVWSGANDILAIASAFAANPATDTTSAITQAADDEVNAVQTLVTDGAKQVLVVGNPNIGLTPRFVGTTASGFVAGLTSEYNGILTNGIAGIGGARITYLDLFPLIANAAAYGFSNSTTACYTGTYSGGSSGTVCDPTRTGQDRYLFWDNLHPTEAGFAVVADRAEVALPEPASWSLLAAGLAGAVAWGRRKRLR